MASNIDAPKPSLDALIKWFQEQTPQSDPNSGETDDEHGPLQLVRTPKEPERD